MRDLIKKYYKGNKVTEYEDLRNQNPKWVFENDVLLQVLNSLQGSIKSVIDLPIGTGRSLQILLNFKNISITGIDLSHDMIEHAKAKDTSGRVQFFESDILSNEFLLKADFVLCYRFMNLLEWTSAQIALKNLLHASYKYVLFTIRTIPDEYKDSIYIEDKIYLHFHKDIINVIKENQFEIMNVFDFKDDCTGDYKVILCERANQIKSCRLNKNQNIVFNYGTSTTNFGKIYEVHNLAHAEFIKYITNENDLYTFFPVINSIDGKFINVEWIKGSLLEKKEWARVLNILHKINSLKISISSSFEYITDLVIPRFLKTIPILGEEFCNQIIHIITIESKRYEKRVSHPDLIPGNIITTIEGLKVIDNELLCYTAHYRVDLLNMLYNLPEDDREILAKTYLNNEGIEKIAFEAEKKYLAAVWLARQAGSLLIGGKVDEIVQLITKYKNRQNILPFDFFK